jgi:hypothetical protein
VTLGIGYNINIFGAVYIKKKPPGGQTEEEQTGFFANPNLVSNRIDRVTLRQRPKREVVVAPIRQTVTLIWSGA